MHVLVSVDGSPIPETHTGITPLTALSHTVASQRLTASLSAASTSFGASFGATSFVSTVYTAAFTAAIEPSF